MPYNDGTKNYQWPANKLTATEMAILYRLREATGKPINQLLREAILKLNETSNGENSNQAGAPNAETK